MGEIKKAKVSLSKKIIKNSNIESQTVDTHRYFPIVGIGASAGGLAAFEAFFSGMPVDVNPNMAFVLIQHLDPNHKSLLSEIMRRYTSMQVFEVEDGMLVQSNCIYIIPPKYDMGILNGKLQLIEPVAPRGQRFPIDFFFRSLALDQQDRAIGIILSGNGSDGTQGLLEIKKVGGLVIAQDLGTAEFDGMPRSAIATSVVDYQMAPDAMAKQLISYASRYFSKYFVLPPLIKDENTWNKIFILLRTQTGHDFSMYKSNTIQRRIERRMIVHQIKSINEYVKYLQHSKDEVDALFNDLLIGVTNFFRDSEAFLSLEQEIIPKLFEGKVAGDIIRVWVAGCSTGEEAYSIAILIKEYMEELKQSYLVQIFATDIDAKAIAIARTALYPITISGNISSQRLERFFIAQADGNSYRINKSIRDMLIFSEHNLIKDPPFSKLDLISCRNLLIYMNVELQKKVLSLFHYALNGGGILFLGSSETVGELTSLFTLLDMKSKLYQCQKSISNSHRAVMHRFMPITKIDSHQFSKFESKSSTQVKVPLRELTEQAILEQIAPASALVNEHGDILYIHGRMGMYLELPSGEAGINNIFKMARDGLRGHLEIALRKAKLEKQTIHSHGIRVKTNGIYSSINFTVRMVTLGSAIPSEQPLYLVMIEEESRFELAEHQKELLDTIERTDETKYDENMRIKELKHELELQKDFLQDANEKLEISNEELKSYNEEIQSMNEELQSTNEELETSKEELQSVNEELSTVNSELQTKVVDLSRSNNDINNLLSGTNIGTIFVDHKLHILRFTPAVTNIINLILNDLGRSIGDIASNLTNYDKLIVDTQAVLNTLIPKEVEVQSREGKWYLMHIQPYRTLDNIIEGAVISFVNITEIVTMREKLYSANQELTRLAVVVHDASDAITVEDMEGNVVAWNPGATKIYGWSETEALKLKANERVPEMLREKHLLKLKELSKATVLKPYNTQRLTKKGSIIDVSITATALINAEDQVYAIATTERPIVK